MVVKITLLLVILLVELSIEFSFIKVLVQSTTSFANAILLPGNLYWLGINISFARLVIDLILHKLDD